MGSSAPLGKGDLFNTPGASLPPYVREVARELMKKGKSKSNAIQIAIGVIKRWAAEGKPKAVAALAEWEKAKATAHATPNKADLSNPVYTPGHVVLLAQDDGTGHGVPPKKKGEKKKEVQGDGRGGKQQFKHGWIPVDENGKPTGPAQKPAWLKKAEDAHKAAGGRSAEAIQAEKAANEFKARARKAGEPARKAKAAADKKAREAKSAALKKKHEREAAARKTASAKKHAEVQARTKANAKTRADEAKKRDRDKQVNAAYKQALADRKAGRELSDQQRRVVAYVEAQQKKDQARLRTVDVPGADGSKVASRAAVPAAKRTLKKADAAKTARTLKAAAPTRTMHSAGSVTSNTTKKRATKVHARSFTRRTGKGSHRGGSVTLSNDDVNVLDFAGSSHPLGQLAFRYKHNWILINPAIPSRGRMGGGLARRHGAISGTTTKGHFADGPNGTKVFVPESHGHKTPAQQVAALKSKAGVNDKSKYSLVAAQDSGNALKPSKPSPEKVDAVSKDANAASTTAQKTKSLADAQVAAKKHADAFVQAKKLGNTKLAESHKANAQAWAKKAQQIKTAEKSSADMKKKYEAEQKAIAREEKAKAKKAEADKAEAQAKAKAVAEKQAAEKKAAAEKAEEHEKAEKAKEFTLKTYQNLLDDGQMDQADAVKKFSTSPDALNNATAEDFKKLEIAHNKKKYEEAMDLTQESFLASSKAKESAKVQDHKDAADVQIKAGEAWGVVGDDQKKAYHFDKAAGHAKLATAMEEQRAEKKSAEKLALNKDANDKTDDAYAATLKAQQEDTEKAHLDAFAAHIKAGDAHKKAGNGADASQHYGKANQHEAKAEKLNEDAAFAPAPEPKADPDAGKLVVKQDGGLWSGYVDGEHVAGPYLNKGAVTMAYNKKKAGKLTTAKTTAPSTPPKPDAPDVGPGMAKQQSSDTKAKAIADTLDELDIDTPGSLAAWDDYLHATAAYKADPTIGNMKKMSAAKKSLTAQGVTNEQFQDVNLSLNHKLSPKKKTAAQKKSTAKKTAPPAKTPAELKQEQNKKDYLEAYEDLLSSGHTTAADKLKSSAIEKGFLKESDFPSAPGAKTDERAAAHLKATGQVLGSHGAQVMTGKDGKKYLVKVQDQWQTDLDVATNDLQHALGMPAPSMKSVKLNGKSASSQSMFDAEPAFPNGFDPAKLSPEDHLAIQKQMALDLMIGNHDGHADQWLRTSDGQLVAIDLGQAFKFGVGHNADYKPAGNHGDPVYKKYLASKPDPAPGMDDFTAKLANLSPAEMEKIFGPYSHSAGAAGKLPGHQSPEQFMAQLKLHQQQMPGHFAGQFTGAKAPGAPKVPASPGDAYKPEKPGSKAIKYDPANLPKAPDVNAPKAPEAPVKVEPINLPGPGMYMDGAAIKAAQLKAAQLPPGPQKAALAKAIDRAKDQFEAKHGKPFKGDQVSSTAPVSSFTPQHAGEIHDHPFYNDAKAAGYNPVPNHVNANNGWKPSDAGLPSGKGGYVYSSNNYTSINAQLRGKTGPKGGSWDSTIKAMDAEFAAVPGLTEPIVTTRKMSGEGPFDAAPPYMQPGGVFVDHGYSSTAKDPKIWDGPVHMQVRIPAGTKVLDLNHTTGSQHSSEQEILLDRDTHYRVVSDGPNPHKPGTRLVVVEVVPGPKKPA